MYNTDLPGRDELPSTGRLLRSTALAALIAGALLVTAVLPAEYGIDPTGIGRVLGLTPMGEIKVSLAAEAEAETRAAQPLAAVAAAPPASVASRIDSQAAPVSASAPETAVAAPPATTGKPEPYAGRQDTMTVVLKPGQGAEIKVSMTKDSRVRYEWTSAGGAVNFDTHGDPYNAPRDFYHGYGKGRNQTGDKGELVAAFDGKHGWFWRNRTGGVATVTLKTEGDYTRIERVL